MMIHATSGEGLMNKTADEAFTLFEYLSANSQQWSHNNGRGSPMKAVVYEAVTSPLGNKVEVQARNSPQARARTRPPPRFQIQQRQFQQAPQRVQEQRGDQIGELQDMFKNFMGQQMQTNQNLQNPVNKLEVQVGQIASFLSNRASETFPSQTEVNPRHQEHAKAVHILRSGKQVDNKVGDANEEQEDGENVEIIQPPHGQPTGSTK
ncbi:unnamed protein product [Prunus armeniaca]|uniref:Uncharacterized protein n=1 Tax=Prunus armeniaca TaxID=36596 RepID=A0A6J5TYK7_PRUAR|nr:unnamed protein product [Prunus armeniaca]